MANSKRKCRECKEFKPVSEGKKHPIGWFCSDNCTSLFVVAAQNKATAKKQAKAKRVHRESDKAFKRETRDRKEAVKPISKLLAETQAAVNRYVRLRDRDRGCVSCDKPADWDGQWHASHFHARGRSSRIRFNLLNIHKSCSVCNAHLSGNLLKYEPELIRRVGRGSFDWMESVASEPTRYDPEYLRRMKRIFLKRCRIIEKRL